MSCWEVVSNGKMPPLHMSLWLTPWQQENFYLLQVNKNWIQKKYYSITCWPITPSNWHCNIPNKAADTIYLLHLIRFFRENSQNEFSFLIWLKRRWHNTVSARGQLEATWNLPHVDKRWGASNRCRVLEEFQVKWPRNIVWVSQLRKKSAT